MPQGLKQLRNEQLVRNLSADFQAKYDAAYHWSRACSQFLALPGLRGFWPMGAVGTAGQAQDLSSHDVHLTRNNGPDFLYDGLVPIIDYDGINEYHSHVDAAVFDILGNEGYIDPTYQGLTLGGWFQFDDDPPAATEHLMSKWDATPNRSYSLHRLAATTIQLYIDDTVSTVTSTVTTTDDTWYFLWGRYRATTPDQSVGVNDTIVTAASVAAPITNSNAIFTIAASGSPGNYMDGRASLCWLCCQALSDGIVLSLYEHTKAMFNVK